MEHFKQKLCDSCDASLIQIGDDWYELKLHVHCGEVNANKDNFFDKTPIKVEIDSIPNWDLSDNTIENRTEFEEVNVKCEDLSSIELFSTSDIQPNTLNGFDAENQHYYQNINAEHQQQIDSRCQSSDDINNVLSAVNEQSNRPSSRPSRNPAYLFECHICQNRYAKKRSLNRHISYVHENEQKYICKICNKRFIENSVLKQHLAKHAERNETEETFKLNQDSGLKHSEENITDDLMEEYQVQPQELGYEPILFEDQARRHINRSSRNTDYRFECHICQNRYANERTLSSHIKYVHENDYKHVCKICYKTFIANSVLRQHLITHKELSEDQIVELSNQLMKKPKVRAVAKRQSNPEYKFECPVCHNRYARERTLRSHVNYVHEKTQKYQCNICKKYFIEKFSLKQHIAKQHNTNTTTRDIFKCPRCPKIYDRKKFLDYHIANHSPKKRKYPCSQCEKVYSSNSALKDHIEIIHEGKILYECKICKRSFSSQPNLMLHEVSHTTSYSFVCDSCGKGFHQKGQLLNHMTTHFEVREHECKECDKKFKTAVQLKLHYRVHTGEKFYKCRVDNCVQEYAHSNDLRRHQFNAHGIFIKKYVCQICSKEFGESRSLRKHMKSHDAIL